jgi:hypothetical protein
MLGTGEHVVAAVEKPAWQVGPADTAAVAAQLRQRRGRGCGQRRGYGQGGSEHASEASAGEEMRLGRGWACRR